VLKTTLYAMLYDEMTRKAKYCDKMPRNVMKCINNFFKMSFKYVADISIHHNVFNSEVKVKHYCTCNILGYNVKISTSLGMCPQYLGDKTMSFF